MDNNELLQRIYQSLNGTYAAPTPVTGTGATPVVATAFQVWAADTVIASITINGVVITAFSAVELPSGFTVFGVITSITLSAGSGLAYGGNNNIA